MNLVPLDQVDQLYCIARAQVQWVVTGNKHFHTCFIYNIG